MADSIKVWVALRPDGSVTSWISPTSEEELQKTVGWSISQGSGIPTDWGYCDHAGYSIREATLTLTPVKDETE